MKIIEANISGAGSGPFSHGSRGGFERYSRGPTGGGLTLTIIIQADSNEENKLKRLKSEVLHIVNKL